MRRTVDSFAIKSNRPTDRHRQQQQQPLCRRERERFVHLLYIQVSLSLSLFRSFSYSCQSQEDTLPCHRVITHLCRRHACFCSSLSLSTLFSISPTLTQQDKRRTQACVSLSLPRFPSLVASRADCLLNQIKESRETVVSSSDECVKRVKSSLSC